MESDGRKSREVERECGSKLVRGDRWSEGLKDRGGEEIGIRA
jgi:hypothetical protein